MRRHYYFCCRAIDGFRTTKTLTWTELYIFILDKEKGFVVGGNLRSSEKTAMHRLYDTRSYPGKTGFVFLFQVPLPFFTRCYLFESKAEGHQPCRRLGWVNPH